MDSVCATRVLMSVSEEEKALVTSEEAVVLGR